MAVRELAAPQEECWALIRVRDFLHPGDSMHHPLIDVNGPLCAHQVCTVGLKDLAESGLDKARPTCWRFVAGSSIGPAVGGEVSRLGPVNAPRLTGLLRGPELTTTLAALEHVRKLPEAQADDYELCILNIPGLTMEAFWLKWKPNASEATWHTKTLLPDLIVPFLTVSRNLDRLRTYHVDEFLATVAPLARKQLAMEDSTTAE